MREDAGLAFEAEDRAVDVRLAQEHAGVVDQVARREVVRAVDDDVVVLQDLERVGAGEHGVVLHHIQVRVEALQHDLGGVDLEPADVAVEWMIWRWRLLASTTSKSTRPIVPTPAAARYMRKRSAEAAGADAEHLGGLQLLLALHADLGQDQVPGVTGDLVVGKLWQCGLFYCCRHYLLFLSSVKSLLCGIRTDTVTNIIPPAMEGMIVSSSVSLTAVSCLPSEVPHVVIVQVDVHEGAQFAFGGEQLLLSSGYFAVSSWKT